MERASSAVWQTQGTTYYIGNYYEVFVPTSGTTTFNKYFYFGTQRVAEKIASTLFYFQGDHLGSNSIAMTQAGTSFYTRQTYYPYGAQRTNEGNALPTDYTFTGQKSDDSTGLMYYGARYYDTSLGRFIQADTIVPSPLNPQSLNRFSYTLNNPVRYIDPSGHMEQDPTEGTGGGNGENDQPNEGPEYNYVITPEMVEEPLVPTEPAGGGSSGIEEDDEKHKAKATPAPVPTPMPLPAKTPNPQESIVTSQTPATVSPHEQPLFPGPFSFDETQKMASDLATALVKDLELLLSSSDDYGTNRRNDFGGIGRGSFDSTCPSCGSMPSQDQWFRNGGGQKMYMNHEYLSTKEVQGV